MKNVNIISTKIDKTISGILLEMEHSAACRKNEVNGVNYEGDVVRESFNHENSL
jgi:hypothetical protein